MRTQLEIRDKYLQQLSVFLDLERNIEIIKENDQKKLKTMVNLGADFYAQAVVPDSSKICIHIGLGFHVEFTLEVKFRVENSQAHSMQQSLSPCHCPLVDFLPRRR